MLVDDDGPTNFLNKELLIRYEFAEEVIVKTDGIEALNYLKNECKSSDAYPDLILLDLKMPILHGVDFLKEFHKICKDVKHDIYIVILTYSPEADDVIRVKDLGNYQWVEKPLSIEKLIDIHHKYFRERITQH